jgi:hypothetical protein
MYPRWLDVLVLWNCFHEVKKGNENDGKAFFEESSKQESNNNARHVNEHTTYYVL